MKKIQVSIIMGSDSDLPVMSEAAKVLEEFNVAYEVTIVSAHRTPERMVEFAQAAAGRGVKVIVAGAGGAAHLPGMVAALTTLPVIGVPVQSRTMSGLDSLYSIVQMPPGVPVATMAINGARNAGLMAVKMLAIEDKKLSRSLDTFMKNLAKEVLSKVEKLEKQGFEKYQQGMPKK
jgi:phosphoribosylaminoimidazole carboxylase PurE protein